MGYVLKQDVGQELINAIHQVHAGQSPLNPLVARRLVQSLTTPRVVDTLAERLTDRELDVLRLIAAGQNNQEIAASLVISEKTVKSHITNILNKLHLADRTQAAVYAWQEGIVRRK